MPFNLFSLSVRAAMNPHVVGAALLNSPVSKDILDYCDLSTEIMSDMSFNSADLKSVRSALRDLKDSFGGTSSTEKLYRKKEALARVIFGIQDHEGWAPVGRRWWEDRRLGILKPRSPFREETWAAISEQDRFVELLETSGIDIGEVDSKIIAQGQHILALWKELVGGITEGPIADHWEDLWRIAQVYSKMKWSDVEKIAEELRRIGAFFTLTMIDCLEKSDPMIAVQEIQRIFGQFRNQRPRLEEIASLSDLGKLALYAFIKNEIGRYHEEPYPNFAQFQRALKMAEVFSDLHDFRDFIDPQSTFTRCFKNIVRMPTGIHLNYYDILESLHQKQALVPFPDSAIDMARHALLKVNYYSYVARFVEDIASAQSVIDVETAVLELAVGSIPVELMARLDQAHNPHERLNRHMNHLQFYQANSQVSVEEELSEEQMLAIFHFILLEEEVHNEFSGLHFDQFKYYLEIELLLARMTNNPFDLRQFAERLRKAARTHFHPYAVLKRLLRDMVFFRARFQERAPHVLKEVAAKVFDVSPDVGRAFLTNWDAVVHKGNPDPAFELLRAGLAIHGRDFEKYRATFNREEELKRAIFFGSRRIVEGGIGTYDAQDLFVRVSIYFSLHGFIPFEELSMILLQASVPPRAADVFADEFSFQVREVQPFFEQVNIGWIESIANHLVQLGTPEGLMGEVEDVLATYVLHAKREEREWGFEMLARLRAAESSKLVPADILEVLADILKVLDEVLEHFVIKVQSEGVRKYQDYFGRLLIAKMRQEPWRFAKLGEILDFHAESATAEEAYAVLDALNEFFGPQLDLMIARFTAGATRWVEKPKAIRIKLGKEYVDILSKVESMKFRRIKGEAYTKSITLQLVPHVGALALFYGFFSENCLARLDYAIHSMGDLDFVPYFMVVNGECRGCVQTLTRFATVGGKRQKLLIVTGIDPQKSFILDAADLLKGLEEGFGQMARKEGYDLVVVPAAEFAQSSRRALLRREFKRYTERIVFDEPIGFPQVGIHPDGSPKYYNDVQHREFLVFQNSL